MKELRELNAEELQSQLAEARAMLQKNKFAHTVSPIENPMILRTTRRQIARLEMALAEKRA